MPDGCAAGCFHRCDTAEFGECGVGTNAFGVVCEGDEQGGGGVRADSVDLSQLWACLGGGGLICLFSAVVSASSCRRHWANDFTATVTASVEVVGISDVARSAQAWALSLEVVWTFC